MQAINKQRKPWRWSSNQQRKKREEGTDMYQNHIITDYLLDTNWNKKKVEKSLAEISALTHLDDVPQFEPLQVPQ